MIRSGLILMIKESAGKGKSAYTIGRELGVSKNTARKYNLDQQLPPSRKMNIRFSTAIEVAIIAGLAGLKE